MDLRRYFLGLSAQEKRDFAARADTGKMYLHQLISAKSGRRPSPRMCKKLHQASDGAVTLQELRPDIWGND